MTSPSSMAGASESAWQANDDDALLFDLRLGKYRLGDGVRGYQKPNAVCVNFDDIIRSFDLAIKISPDKSKAQGWAFDEMRALSIERTTQSITLQGRRQALPGDAIVDTREGWCVDTVELSRWLGIQLHLDQANALILVHADHMLPVERMLERRARAASFRPHIQLDENKLPQAVLPYRMWRTPALDVVVTLNGTHDRQRGAKGNRSVELYAAGEIARASVDARLSTDTHAKPSSLRLRGYRMSLGGKLLGPLGATYLAVGDVSSYGSPLVAQAMPGRGVAVTNRLLDQPDIFDRTSWQSNERQGWRVGLGYDHSLSRARTAIGYTHRFDRFALSATGEFSTDRSVAAGLNLAFSLGRNPTGHGLRLTSEKQATLGSVVTRVFRDTNNDGSYQAGEPLEPGVKIAIGKVPTSRSTGMNGLATINSLTPFQPVLIGIEGASLADPHVQPKGPGMIVTPRPGIDALVDIPLVSTGEVDGMLVRAGGGPLEGVDIELVTSQGTVQAITRSEYDGFFLFESVPYGKYSLRVAPLSASAARLDTANVQDVAVSNIAVSLHLGVVAIPSQRMTAHTAP